ncbi:branched-chain amino acid aminotransferase [Talaromyces islandicus]|uniref:Branched-chain-amino-acid aminotransferase n=1 Tax=Talaromyces islandicus TaxID=28573 RepID=A0A0U1LXS6_TALIS|nr:branched-chain amino acid aminotransferase [Talaromyces islandicus]
MHDDKVKGEFMIFRPYDPVFRLTPTLYCGNIVTQARQIHSKQSPQGQLDSTKLVITTNQAGKSLSDENKLQFGREFTDHILSIKWNSTEGWLSPKIEPYHDFKVNPAACAFHYAFSCFEGMKAYRDLEGKARLFRPDRNFRRLNQSASRLALPNFDEVAMVHLLAQYVKLEDRFIPRSPGFSLYLRPTLVGTEASISVSRPREAMLYVIASPMGNYFTNSASAISLEATASSVRAWPGGVGDCKFSGNYAPSIVPQEDASSRGFQQNLWLLGEGENAYVTEAGTMNIFIARIGKHDGIKELVTPPLDGTILPGVTRESILELAKERLMPQGWRVSENKILMSDLAKASDDGHLLEVFGTGTAAVVSPIRNIQWRGKTINCGLEDNVKGGPISLLMKEWVENIQYGKTKHPWR